MQCNGRTKTSTSEGFANRRICPLLYDPSMVGVILYHIPNDRGMTLLLFLLKFLAQAALYLHCWLTHWLYWKPTLNNTDIDKSLDLEKISKRNDPYFSLLISRNEILFLFSIFRIFNILENILFLFLIFELMKKYFSFSSRFMRFQSIFLFLLSLKMQNLRERNFNLQV